MKPRFALRAAALSLALLLLGAGAQAVAPTRVARLGYLDGDVSFLEAGETDWVQASLNRPLTIGDHLWTNRSALAELQLEGAAIRIGERSNLSVLNLDERITQLQLSQGALRLRVRALGPQQSIEVDTPNLAMVLRRTGDYRIEVDPQGDSTLVLVQGGQAEVFGDGASYRVDSSQAYRFYGTGLSDYEGVSDYGADELDRWAQERERRLANSASARYVPAGVVGYEDLDANGRWVVDASYGNVWLPSRVAAGWTPYRDGRWTWVDPWGWTWIDDAPWGYAVSHYGRWAYLGNTWGWVPGAARERVVYAPALVVFVSGNQARTAPDRRAGLGNTGWFPLGPRDVYRQGQAPAREGYANRHVRGAVVAAVNQPPRERAPDAEARSRPPRDNQPVVAHTAPPAAAAAAAPAKSANPAEPPVRARVATPAAAPVPITVPPQAPRSETPRGEGRPARAKPAAPSAASVATPVRVEQARGESPKNDAVKNNTVKSEVTGAVGLRNDAAKNDAARNDAAKAAAAKVVAGKLEAARNAATQADTARAEAAKAEAGRNAAVQAEAARARAAQEQAARAAESKRNNATRADAVRAEAAKAEAARAEAANAMRAEKSRAEQARQPGRGSDTQRGNAQRPGGDLTPEEELQLRDKRKQ
jgi:hypothetical protein